MLILSQLISVLGGYPSNLEMTIVEATEIICRWSTTANKKLFLFHYNHEDIIPYVLAVEEIHRTIDSEELEEDRKQADSVMQIAVTRLTEEFCNIIRVNRKTTALLNPNSQSTTMTDSCESNYKVYENDHLKLNLMSKLEILYLQCIAQTMNTCGFAQECIEVYVNERKSVMDYCFRCLHIQNLSENTARRLDWEELELKIKCWIRAAKIFFKYYFQNEKKMCEQIFLYLGDNAGEVCFIKIVQDHIIRLLINAEAFSCIRPATERLFKTLDVCETLFSLLPAINKLLDNTQFSEFVRSKIVNEIVPKLGDTAKEMLLKFYSSLVNEQLPVVHGETVHRLVKYVMNYVYNLCDHRQTLMMLSPSILPSTGVRSISLGLEWHRQFSAHLIWIIMSLVSKLEVKVKLCNDPSASRLFVMNNIYYMIQQIRGLAELREMVGDENFNKLSEKFEQAKADYLNLTFDVVLKFLRDDGLKKNGILSFRAVRLTNRLRRFNSKVEKLQKDLGKIVVADSVLVFELRKSIVEMMVSAYTSFLLEMKNVTRIDKYAVYSAEGLESAIQSFFVVNPN